MNRRQKKFLSFAEWMEINGYSINRMAKEMGVSHMTVRRYMAKEVVPTPENMCKIRKICRGEVLADSFYCYAA